MQLRALSATLLVAVTLVACAEATSDPDTGSAHPTGADELVLRVATGGGFTPVEYQLRLVPEFSLFGDGTLITPGAQAEIYPGPALPPLASRALSQDGLRTVLEAAVAAGVADGKDLTDLASTFIADAPTTTFTISIDEATHTFSVYALFEMDARPEQMSVDEFEARQALAAFVTRLNDLSEWLPEGALGPEAVYEAHGSLVFVGGPQRVPDLPQEPIGWPLGTSLANVPSDTAGYGCLAVIGEDWRSTLAPLAASANELTPWVSGGERFGVVFRPLLPDQEAC